MVRSCCYLDVYPRHGDIGVDGMDSLLECLVLLAHGFLLWHPMWLMLKINAIFIRIGNPHHAEARTPFLGNRVRWASDGIPSTHAIS
jgi:hypothetical protein